MITRKLVYLFLCITCLSACNKDITTEPTSLEVNLLGVEFTENLANGNDPQGSISRAAIPLSQASASSRLEVPVDQDLGLTIEWKPDDASMRANTENTSTSGPSTGSRAAAYSGVSAVSWKLPDGIKFRLLAYAANGDRVVDTVYTVGQNKPAGLQLNSGDEYTFVAYSILSKTDVPVAPTGKLADATITNVTGDMDFVYFSKKLRLSSGRNELNIFLKHQFSQIITQVDASAVGNISNIKMRINNHYLAPTIQLATGKVSSYQQRAENGKVIPFNTTSSRTLSADSTIICNNGQANSTLMIDEITINNITKRNLSISNIELAPGSRYILSLKINSFTADQTPGIELGTSTYAAGNLVYDRSKDSYGFADKGDGDYWFKNYLKPRRADLDNKGWGENNQRPRSELNGGFGDPCAKVLPLNSWRLPVRAEMENIRTATEAQVNGHPGPNIYAPVRYVEENYRSSGKRGMHFGTQNKPSEKDISKYLFVPFAGIYNDNQHKNDINTTGWYMLKNGHDFEYMQIGPNIYTFNFYTLPENTAVSIRCVKAN